ncbi:ATP-binding protein [uncultured Jatrophihabitans sp.]|uniref:ATP-binding protein n=1 Tax=uncultured Jatrophihabitans sp. TaxID=1610747 RepID=UPI0035C96712
MDIPATPLGLAAARHVVIGLLPGWDLPDQVCDKAELVISELVTNAIVHSPLTDSFELELVRQADGVRVSLADGSSIRPVIRELSRDLPSGRGMFLVEHLASEWGSDEHAGGKRVWVTLTAADW